MDDTQAARDDARKDEGSQLVTRPALLAAILATALLTVVAPDARAAAGSYRVTACNQAPEGVDNSWTWATADASQPSPFVAHQSCPFETGGAGEASDQEGGLSTTDVLGLSSGAAPGSDAGWTFTAPTGTTISGIDYERYLGHMTDPDNYWSPALRADDAIVPGETCLDSVPNSETCSVGGPPGEGTAPGEVTGLSAHELTLGLTCDGGTGEECVTGATQHKVWAAMYGATVTVSDPTPPTLVTPSGAPWIHGAAGGFHKGTESLATSAQDVGGGVQSILLSADGQPVETYTGLCNFTFPQPCPSSTGTQTLTLPTTELSDGTHILTLVAVDAADDQSPVASEQITVDNNPPAAPTGLAATATPVGGAIFTATWIDPSGQVAPITTATYQLCPVDASGSCGAPMSAPSGEHATITAPGAGTWSLAVWLTDAAGNGNPANSAHALLIVPALPDSSGPNASSTLKPKSRLRIRESLHGRELVVHVNGPETGPVHLWFTGRLHGQTVASAARTMALKNGRLTATFKLGVRTAAHATIRVSAKLGHEIAVTSTLGRYRSHHPRRSPVPAEPNLPASSRS